MIDSYRWEYIDMQAAESWFKRLGFNQPLQKTQNSGGN